MTALATPVHSLERAIPSQLPGGSQHDRVIPELDLWQGRLFNVRRSLSLLSRTGTTVFCLLAFDRSLSVCWCQMRHEVRGFYQQHARICVRD